MSIHSQRKQTRRLDIGHRLYLSGFRPLILGITGGEALSSHSRRKQARRLDIGPPTYRVLWEQCSSASPPRGTCVTNGWSISVAVSMIIASFGDRTVVVLHPLEDMCDDWLVYACGRLNDYRIFWGQYSSASSPRGHV